jgi:hypothetical protein
MKFEVIGQIREVRIIAKGPGVQTLAHLRKAYAGLRDVAGKLR